MKTIHRRRKQRTTVVILLPELLQMNMLHFVKRGLELTGCTSIVEHEIVADPEDIEWLSPHRSSEYRRLTAEHLQGKIIKILIIKGEDIVRRASRIIGKQDDPSDWPLHTIQGQLLQMQKPAEIICARTREGKKHYWPFILCPKTHTAAKRLLKRLKIYFGRSL